jgi:hypothetical protein
MSVNVHIKTICTIAKGAFITAGGVGGVAAFLSVQGGGYVLLGLMATVYLAWVYLLVFTHHSNRVINEKKMRGL